MSSVIPVDLWSYVVSVDEGSSWCLAGLKPDRLGLRDGAPRLVPSRLRLTCLPVMPVAS
jgi:hypothetical protein